MMFGLPTKALHQPHITEVTSYESRIEFVASVFLRKPKGFEKKLVQLTNSNEHVSLTARKGATYKITYERFEDLGAIEFLPLILTYLIVFLYLLFSLAKVKTLRSRWGLAFSAIMTLILSLGMTVGICASMDLIPVTISITEIFPYVVIVLGIENVLKITNAVMTDGHSAIPDRIAHGLRRESTLMVQNLGFMLLILTFGLVTNIPAIKEFSAFVAVGLVCNFFMQLVFYTPILYVDIKRTGLLPLHVSIQDSLKISFNLIPSPSHSHQGDTPVPPSPTLAPPAPMQNAPILPTEKAEFSFFYWWERLRIFQRLFMVGFVIYLSYSVYFTFYVPNADVSLSQRLFPSQSAIPTQKQQNHQSHSRIKCLSDYEARTESFSFPWQFSCSQIYPEILTFYQMHLHERSLVMLPLSVLHFNIGLDDLLLPVYDRDTFWQANSSLLVASLVVILFVVPCLCALVLVRTAHQSKVIEPEVDSFIWKGHEYQVEWIVTDGVYIASLCLGGYIRIWDSLADNCKAVIDRRASSARSLPESDQDLPRLRSSSSAKDLLSREKEAAQVWCMDAFNGLLGLGCSNGTVEIYSLSRESLIARQDAPSLGVTCLTFLSRKTVAAAHLDGSIDFISINWHKKQRSSGSIPGDKYSDTSFDYDDRSNQQCQYTNVTAFREGIHSMVTVAGRVIAIGDNRIIKVFEGRDAVCLKSIRLRSGDVNVVCIQEPANPVILCGTTEGVIHKFDVIQGQLRGDITGLSGSVISIKTNQLYTCALSALNVVMVWANETQEIVLSRTFINPIIDIAVLGANVLTIIMETHMELIPITDTSSYKIQRHSSLGSCMPLLPNQICCVDQSSLVVARGAEIEHFKFPNLVNKVE